jgi:hypothetical protein
MSRRISLDTVAFRRDRRYGSRLRSSPCAGSIVAHIAFSVCASTAWDTSDVDRLVSDVITSPIPALIQSP